MLDTRCEGRGKMDDGGRRTNSKFEARNPKQIRIFKITNSKTTTGGGQVSGFPLMTCGNDTTQKPRRIAGK